MTPGPAPSWCPASFYAQFDLMSEQEYKECVPDACRVTCWVVRIRTFFQMNKLHIMLAVFNLNRLLRGVKVHPDLEYVESWRFKKQMESCPNLSRHLVIVLITAFLILLRIFGG